MSTETEETAANLALIELEVPGIVETFAEAPDTISAASMPLFLNIPGQATYGWEGDGLGEQGDSIEGLRKRDWDCLLIMAAYGTGIPGEVIKATEPFFDSVPRVLMAHQNLKGQRGILQVRLLGDGGLGKISVIGNEWAGVRFRLQVTERFRVVYAQNE